MAETIVKLVLQKITEPLVKEVLHLWRVEEQVEKVRRELDWIQAFLKDADRKQIEHETQKQWVREVREVAYCIEDVIDTFLCEVPQKKPGKREAVKRWFGGAPKLPVIHKLEDEINQILKRLQEINDMRVRYGIRSLGEGSGGVKELPVRPPVLPDIEDPDVVGLDEDRDNIVKELLDETTPRRCVVSIVGPGGLGKTTLAKKAYNSDKVKRAFHIRIWIAISQEFKLIDVLRKILENLRKIKESEQGNDIDYFLMELNKSLKGKKYLLTMDDVWTKNLWMVIEQALPNERNGSRILMTTRNCDVAKDADSEREPYKLNFLAETSSLELLLKKALPNPDIQNKCSSHLFDLAKQFVKKCGGLPLALVVLGGFLAKKQHTYSTWRKVLQTMNWHVDEQKVCTEIIGTSFNDLPLALKSCFMYFAMFPENYEIYVADLIPMWIAEGFIPHEEHRTLEDTAQSFLEDLAQRSMVQVLQRTLWDDSILFCRIHDLLLDLAIQKANEDNFLTVCSNQDVNQGCGRARRVAIHNLDCNTLMNYGSPNLRTLFGFKNSLVLDCSGHMHLKVLHLETIAINLDGLSQLRYLHVLDSRIDKMKPGYIEGSIENFIGSMKFLQTLIVISIPSFGYLPTIWDCLWRIKTLRHIILPGYPLGPPPSTDLRNLQSLSYVRTRETWKPTTLPNIPNLRTLAIEISEGFSSETFIAFLYTLKKLEFLTIKGRDIPIEIIDMREFPFYGHLTMLRYIGRLCCQDRQIALDFTMFPTHITALILMECELQQDHLIVLEKVPRLKLLHLITTYPNHKMRCSTGGFPLLQELELHEIKELEELEIDEGAMPMLKNLRISNCPMLQVPHGLKHLNTLRNFRWTETLPDKSSAAKAREIRNICKNVPSIELLGLEEDSG